MPNSKPELPSKKCSKIEWNYPEEVSELSDNHVQLIKDSLDPLFIERANAGQYFTKTFLDPFTISLKKFSVLKKVHREIYKKIESHEPPSDVVMLLIYEDSVKYCAISFNEIAKKLIAFINGDLKGKHLTLLRRNGLKPIVRATKDNSIKKSTEYETRLSDYQKTWDRFFPSGTNSKNGPTKEDLEAIKNHLEDTIQKLRAYRDKVVAHFDDEVITGGLMPILLWTELEEIIVHLQSFLQDFYFLLTHTNIQCDDLDGIGFISEEDTVESFISGIFRDSTVVKSMP